MIKNSKTLAATIALTAGAALLLSGCGDKTATAVNDELFPTARPAGQGTDASQPAAAVAAPSSIEVADPVELGKAWIALIQAATDESFAAACAYLTPYAVNDLVTGFGREVTCSEGLFDDIHGLGDPSYAGYDAFFSAKGAVTWVGASDSCADPALELGDFCWIKLGWSEEDYIMKIIVKTEGGFQIGVLDNEQEDSYASTHGTAGAEIGDL